MNKKRTIQPIVRKVSFAEAEHNDDVFWGKASYFERLKSAFELRKISFGNEYKNDGSIRKVAFKRKLHDEEI
ncbi:MAG TPA: hypothetical protein PJ990_18950 [Saprospiraceae bacterium]|jgi:hypothetical protein|nr:hypothetical protein [Saprospiraceae bacterium]